MERIVCSKEVKEWITGFNAGSCNTCEKCPASYECGTSPKGCKAVLEEFIDWRETIPIAVAGECRNENKKIPVQTTPEEIYKTWDDFLRGKRVRDKLSKVVGIVYKVTDKGEIKVVITISPTIISTYTSLVNLELMEEDEL